MIAALKASGRWERTIFIVAGDHGEAFGERGGGRPGHIIHNGVWSREQLEALLVVRVPGMTGRRIARPTSHLDLVATLADVMAFSVDAQHYSNGVSLLADDGPAARVVGGWEELGLVDSDYALRLGIGADNRWLVQASDADGIPVSDPGVVLEHFADELPRVSEMMQRFRK